MDFFMWKTMHTMTPLNWNDGLLACVHVLRIISSYSILYLCPQLTHLYGQSVVSTIGSGRFQVFETHWMHLK